MSLRFAILAFSKPNFTNLNSLESVWLGKSDLAYLRSLVTNELKSLGTSEQRHSEFLVPGLLTNY